MDEPVPVLEPVLPRRPRQIGVAAAALAVALVGVTAVWGVFVLARPAPVTDPPLRLVVVETDGGVTTTDGFGTTRHALHGSEVRYQFPAWSPDGTKVAAIGRLDNIVTVDVFDADPAASALPRRIYESAERPAFYLYWAPDSQHVTFLTTEPNPDGIALRIAPADGSGPSEIVRAAAPLYWDFVDSSRLLLHTGSSGSTAFTGEVDLEGTSLEDDEIASGLFRAPAVGGDGSSRAYVVSAGEDPFVGGTMVVEARDGSVRHEIPVGGATAFGFDPTSTTLAFIAPDEPADPPAPIPSGALRTVDAGTGEVRTLLDANVLAFFWSPDGRTIAALDLRPAEDPGPGEARALDGRLAAATSGTPGALPPFAEGTPGVGLHLTFIDAATADIRSERDLRLSELFAFQVLPYFDQYALSHRFWAPDSSAIVLPLAEEDGLDRIVVIPADGRDPREVATGWVGFWSP
jgi:TolB protein